MISRNKETRDEKIEILSISYQQAQTELFQGLYNETANTVFIAQKLLQELEITSFTPTTPRHLNPTAWAAISAALKMRQGHYHEAENLARDALAQRNQVLGNDITLLDNVSIRFLLIQILLEKRDLTAANFYLQEVSSYFTDCKNKQTEPYLTLYFSYLTFQSLYHIYNDQLNDALTTLKQSAEFYNTNKATLNNRLAMMLPTFSSYYAYVKAQDKGVFINKIKALFNEAEESFKIFTNPNNHISKVEFLILKAKAFATHDYYKASKSTFGLASNMLHQIFPNEPSHPYQHIINDELSKITNTVSPLQQNSFLARSISSQSVDPKIKSSPRLSN